MDADIFFATISRVCSFQKPQAVRDLRRLAGFETFISVACGVVALAKAKALRLLEPKNSAKIPRRRGTCTPPFTL